MEYTKNYHLPQWAESDRILMTDFNQMCADMEAGLDAVKSGAAAETKTLAESVDTRLESITANLGSGGKTCRIAWGSYVGTGAYGAANPNSLTFGFRPVLVFLISAVDALVGGGPRILIRDCDNYYTDSGGQTFLTWTDAGLSWYDTGHADSQFNTEGQTFYYYALGCGSD